MELQIDIDGAVVEWLAAMGYPVAGMPHELLHGMLLKEARQWELSPEALRALIDEGASQSPEVAANNHRFRKAARRHHMGGQLVHQSL